MKGLTQKQQLVHDLRVAGKTRVQSAAELDISIPVVSKQITVINKKLGVAAPPAQDDSLEYQNPEKAATVIEALSDPALEAGLRTMEEACKAVGLPVAAHRAVVRRMLVRYGKPIQVAKDIRTKHISDMLDEKIWLAGQFMDEFSMSNANFRDLALGVTAMVEKRQLLRGEPTQIVSDHERKKLHELMPLLLAEAQRRGVVIAGTVAEKTIEPVPEYTEPEKAVV